MIKSKAELKEYILADMLANHFNRWSSFTNTRCKYLRVLRKLEYLVNVKGSKILIIIYRRRLQSLSERLGITIGLNCFGKGLYLPHYGSIVVNGSARFGDYCIVQNGVNISESAKGGNRIYLGAGAKLLIGVHLADNIIVGANAVVTKSFEESNVVLAGIPAKKISNNGMASGRIKV